MTFLDIFQDVARRCDKNPTAPDPETQARLRMFINDRYREVMRLPGVIDLRDEVLVPGPMKITAGTTAGQNRLVLPDTVRAITNVVDSTHRVKLTRVSMSWIRERDPSEPGTSMGTPTHYAILNHNAVKEQPASIHLEVSSDSFLDDGVVSIEYQDHYGAFRVEKATLTGVSPMPVPGAAATMVFRMSVDRPPDGQIKLVAVQTNQTLLTIQPNSMSSQTNNPHTSSGWTLWLWPTPSGVFNITVDGTMPRAAMVDWMDEPMLPEDFHTVLVWGACEDEMLHMDDNRAGAFADRWRKDISALKGFLHQVRGERLIPRGSRPAGWSPFGGNYPTWY
jgi:hypothetical protein